ncbi:MAG TPA: cytochrome c [Candidatus Methylacidiphilales bacterium]
MYRWIIAALALILIATISPFAALLAQSAPETTATPDLAQGKELYTDNCSSCHQAGGVGMANMSPALKDNPIVAGDSKQLIQIVLKGPAAVLPANRPHFGSSTMDSFYYKLDDNQVAAILTYIRQDLNKGDKPPSAIAAKDVAAIRASIDPQTLDQ